MVRFKKDYNLKIALLIISICLSTANSVMYGAENCLRKPLDFNGTVDSGRYQVIYNLNEEELLVNIGNADIDEKGQFTKVVISEDSDIGFVIKVPKKDENIEMLLAGYNLAKNALGGVAAKTTQVKNAAFMINGQKFYFKTTLIQEKVTPLKTVFKEIGLEQQKMLLDKVFDLERELYRRGVHNIDHKILEAYGINKDGDIVLFDFSHISNNQLEFYLKSQDDDWNMMLYNISLLRHISKELAEYYLLNEINSTEFDSLWKSNLDLSARIEDVNMGQQIISNSTRLPELINGFYTRTQNCL
jgi:hypothetical protein